MNSNPTLTGIHKLNYLRSQLCGEACDVIAGLALTSPNYDISVTLLKDRYGQPDKLVLTYMQAFLDLPNPLNTLTSLQSFGDGVEKYIHSLSTLGMDVEAYGAQLVPVILNKLPPKTKKNMIRERDGDEWTLKN